MRLLRKITVAAEELREGDQFVEGDHVHWTVKAKILILNGADDPFVKREQYDTLKKDLDAAKADYRIIEYPGAVHAFTNPEATAIGQKFNLPLKYDAKVDGEAKAEAAKLFASTLKK